MDALHGISWHIYLSKHWPNRQGKDENKRIRQLASEDGKGLGIQRKNVFLNVYPENHISESQVVFG